MSLKVASRCVVLAVFLIVAIAASAQQQPPTQTFYLTLLTKIDMPMKMPGMPNLPQMPGMPTGKPQREISGRATYGATPVAPIFVTVPADLKLPNNKLVLEIPKSVTGTGPEGEEGTPANEGKTNDVTLTNKLYWHPDQAKGPETETFSIKGGKVQGGGGMMGMKMPDLSKLADLDLNREASGANGKLPDNVVGSGDYTLNTGGQATMTGYLAPLKVTMPANVDPSAGILVKWESVPNARGYLLSATGMEMTGGEGQATKMTTTSWFSTLVKPPLRIRSGYQQETTIADDLKNGILLPADTTSCLIPAGIFDDVMFLNLRLEAVGNDFYSKERNITTFGTIRSQWQSMLMLGMGMGMGAGEDE